MASKQFTAFSGTPKTILVILILGVLLRFVQQFLLPVFNGDEVALGLNIRFRDAEGLLYPLSLKQSSPPLFLQLQKLLTFLPIPVWISLKLLSFFSSVCALLLFGRLLRHYEWFIAAVPLVIFAFNPFILANSLTLKQYTFDLLGILLLVNFYTRENFKRLLPLFFLIWCLISNIGLFGCAGYLLFLFIQECNFNRPSTWLPFLKRNFLILIAPVPYVIYFVWFMQQDGAHELKIFMQDYWKNSFIPLNGGIFKYAAYFLHSVWIFIFNAYEPLGLTLLCVCGVGLFRIALKKQLSNKPELMLLAAILLVNVVLNILHLYPLSDRLYLYTVPLYLLLFCASFEALVKEFKAKKIVAVVIIVLLLGTFATYSYNKDNNFPMLYAQLDRLEPKQNQIFYATDRTISAHDLYNRFTQDYFLGDRSLTLLKLDQRLEGANFLISRVHSKFGPFNKTAAEEIEVVALLEQNKIVLVEQTDGYNVYKIKRQ